jgi:ubiquinone/menaquinone biosynthesis C-methylase UbiE
VTLDALKLNLGACDRSIPGFLSVDICPPADVVADLSLPWPWPDSSVDEVRAHDVFEHLPSRIQTMNELWRVLKPRGHATVEVPSATKGAGFAQDPTHVSAWCMNSFQYFEFGSFAHKRLAKSYGITARFKIVSLTEREYQDAYEKVWKITAVLECVK